MSGSGFDSDNESEKKPSTSRFSNSSPVPKKRKRYRTRQSDAEDSETPTAESSDSDSDESSDKGTKKTVDFEVLCSYTSQIKGTPCGFQAMMSTSPGRDGILQQPIFFKKCSGHKLDLKLPTNIERSKKMEFIDAIIRENLAQLHISTPGTSWSLQPGAQHKEPKEVLLDYYKKQDPKKTVSERTTDFASFLTMATHANRMHVALSYTPVAMGNTVGKSALFALLHMCKFVVQEELNDKGMHEGKLVVETNGMGKWFRGNLKLKIYQMYECTTENAVNYLTKQELWPKNHTYKYPKTTIPDVQCQIIGPGSDPVKARFPITAEVKSSGEVRTHCAGTLQKSLFEQTWLQALVGLRDSDVSYGVLLQPLAGTVMRLKVHEQTRKCRTHTECFDFYDGDEEVFQIEEFMGFMKAIVGIFLELELKL